MPKASPLIWAKMLEKYGDDGKGQVPKEWRGQAVEEYKRLGGKLLKPVYPPGYEPAGQEARGKTLKAPK